MADFSDGVRKVASVLAQTWPARLAQSAWSAATLPGDVYQGNVSMYGADGRTNPDVIGRSADLAGMLTLGAGAVPAEANSLRAGWTGPVFRRTRGESPDNGAGHMMFADDLSDVGIYGPNLWTMAPENVPSQAIVHADSPEFRRALYRVLRSEHDRPTTRALVDEANPSQIVNSAGLWDNLDLTQTVWDKLLEPKGHTVVRTNDGAVAFDPQFVRRAKADEFGE